MEQPRSAQSQSPVPRFSLSGSAEGDGRLPCDQDTAAIDQSDEALDIHNMECYVIRTLSYCLDKGIRKQLDAFKGEWLGYTR